jgi:branched-chain amino acid transport system permease protein
MFYLVALLELAGLNVILALSVYATLMVGQFSLAQVGFWSIGAFSTGMLVTLYGAPLLVGLIASGALCAAVGVILGYPCLRIRGIYLTLATVAFTEVVRVFFHNFQHRVEVDGQLLGPAGPIGFRGISVLTTWPQILLAVLVFIAIFAWIERSRIGLAANAIREDETAAACTGVNPVAIKVGMFAFGAFVAGVGGGLYATYASYVVSENFGFHMALISIFYVAIGGTNRFIGPVVGAILLTLLPEAFRFAGDFRMILYAIAVIGLVIIFPRGLVDELVHRFGARRARSRRGQRGIADAGSTGPST